MLVRRERAHPGAQLSFSDHDGHRFQATLTDQPDTDIQLLERRQRQRARAEDHIRNDKDTGLRNMLFCDFEHNRVWLAVTCIAHDLIVWTQRLLLSGELTRCEPKPRRYRLLHVAARLAFHARKATLRIHNAWPWAHALADAQLPLKKITGGAHREGSRKAPTNAIRQFRPVRQSTPVPQHLDRHATYAFAPGYAHSQPK